MVAESTAAEQPHSGVRSVRLESLVHRAASTAILALSGVLNFWNLSAEGYANTYYAAAVRSMLQSWHNFFFVSFDPGGFVTVDKPPLGFWVQTASAKIFGFSGMSILVPEAIAGVLAVALLYHLVARTFGPIAGLLATLALAVSPVSVVTARNNTIDSILVLSVLLAAWAVLRAAEAGRLRWLILGAALVGLGFNIKMLEAYLVVPALGLVYLLGAPVTWPKRILHLVAAAAVLLLISFAWIAAVDLTPASQRPYVGSSANNSELNLAIGYNGLGRLTGNPFGQRTTARVVTGSEAPTGAFTEGETGAPGPLRLLNTQLAGQISWLLVLAIIGFVAAAIRTRPRFPIDREQQSLALWGMWLLTMGIFFSDAGFWHTYYLTMVAPSIAALAAIGIVTMWRSYRAGGWQVWFLPAALIASVVVEAHILADYADADPWRTPLLVAVCLLAAALLVLAGPRIRWNRAWLAAILAGAASLLLLAPPAAWAADSVTNSALGGLPHAGPNPASGSGGPGGLLGRTPIGARSGFRRFRGGRGPGDNSTVNQTLLRFLESHQGRTQFLLAVDNAGSAAPYILETGKPVMALGGFIGDDRIVTPARLARLVRDGTVRYFLLTAFGGGFRLGVGGRGGNGDLNAWVQQHCATVPAAKWGGSSGAGFSGGFAGPPPGPGGSPPPGVTPPPGTAPPGAITSVGFGQQLYDCSGR